MIIVSLLLRNATGASPEFETSTSKFHESF